MGENFILRFSVRIVEKQSPMENEKEISWLRIWWMTQISEEYSAIHLLLNLLRRWPLPCWIGCILWQTNWSCGKDNCPVSPWLTLLNFILRENWCWLSKTKQIMSKNSFCLGCICCENCLHLESHIAHLGLDLSPLLCLITYLKPTQTSLYTIDDGCKSRPFVSPLTSVSFSAPQSVSNRVLFCVNKCVFASFTE